jgi:hypothetical protein
LPVVAAADDTCTALLTDGGTFIREEAQPVLHAVHHGLWFAVAAPTVTARGFAGHHRGVVGGPVKPFFVLRV